MILDQIYMVAWDIASVNAENTGDPPSSNPEAQRFYAEATGARVPTSDHLDEWLASLQVKPKTANMRRSTIQRLAAKFPMLQDINRGEVRRWVTELTAELEPATVRRMLSDCRSFWQYLATVGAVAEDSAPFDRLGLKVPVNHRQAWAPEELVRLHRAADGALADLILLAMYSGARLSELANLRVADVAKDHFTIREAKTAAGRRQVPLHRKLRPAMARLTKGKAPSDYVLTGIKGKHRADTMSKAFRRLRENLGFTAKQEKTLHSIRKTVGTQLENALVNENIVADLLGHEKPRVTYGIYSGGTTLAVKAEALAKLAY
ncbi:MAG: site-specific integrase [Alphaproteobacteria bacterium]